MDLVFEALGAIIYDIEWTADPAEPRQILMRLPVPRGPSYTVCLPNTRAGWETRAAWETCEYVFELMLCIDYGLPGYPLRGMRGLPRSWFIRDHRQLDILARVLTGASWYWGKGQGVPSNKAWDSILRVVGNWENARVGVPVWDIATMLYYYNTRRKSVSAEDQNQGWTGYTGVLQEMISEGSSPPGAQAVA
ncbi:hypothetical protein NEMBOFW57_009425 [Staphylotrichum longicolle]|uniref:Uncharacterized protein n=1 Tax=Staphylotrichum longicolle TaxID=669026 RepID=A0AAD4EPG3_9PEZI|nr:hypothetical protein NEMBOFW57_009425 [Staphylotrichum longicolle]